jgi:peroxiredoxin Q/BCP
MTTLRVGDYAPGFCLPDPENIQICLKDLKGKWVVLYFYPKDGTKGCTLEALEFTEAESEFRDRGAIVLGISKDSPESHIRFKEKNELSITLLSDEETDVLEKYGAWQKKKMYGREFMGAVRSTYLIDPEGMIAHIWPKVKAMGHAKEVMAKLKAIQEST